ncbi:MAG: HAD family hydrolase [Pseudomonadota bacterium]
MSGTQHVVFCDLDGTLVLDNSFHVFLSSAWSLASSSIRFTLVVRLVPRVLGRAGGGHPAMKRRVLDWFWRQDPHLREAIVDRTVNRLRHTLSHPVVTLLETAGRNGARIVLATAAPDIYAERVKSLIGAEDCLATPGRPSAGWVELLGEAKANACRRWLKDHCLSDAKCQITVITDHPDDLPLLRLADSAVVQGSARTLEALEHEIQQLPEGKLTKIIKIDVLSAQGPDGGYWLWFDDRPEGPLDDWEIRTILSKHRHAYLYIGDGKWHRIGPGQSFNAAVRRHDCPRPPSMRMRLAMHLRRRILRDWLGMYH